MTEFELGWVVGILEGEGSFTCSEYRKLKRRNGREHYWRDANVVIRVVNTDFEILERLHRLTGVGRIYNKALHSDLARKPQKEWRVYVRNEVYDLLALIHEHMSERRQIQIDLMFAYLERGRSVNHGPVV